MRSRTCPRCSFCIIRATAISRPWPTPSPRAPALLGPKSISSASRKPCPRTWPAKATTSSTRPRRSPPSKSCRAYDAIVIGTGTRYGRLSTQMAAFLDRTGGLWARGALNGKVGAAFTSTATQHGGQEATLFSLITNLLHFGMVVVGLPYSFQGQMRLDEVTGDAPYGATTIAGGDGSRRPSATELDGARYLGRHVAEIAAKVAA